MRMFLAAAIAVLVLAGSASASELSLRVCAERKENIPVWQKEHYAFAISTDGEACGWMWSASSARYAAAIALRACRQPRGNHTKENIARRATCRVIYAK